MAQVAQAAERRRVRGGSPKLQNQPEIVENLPRSGFRGVANLPGSGQQSTSAELPDLNPSVKTHLLRKKKPAPVDRSMGLWDLLLPVGIGALLLALFGTGAWLLYRWIFPAASIVLN